MAQYEKRYNKGGRGNYDQGGQRKSIPLKPIIYLLLLLLLCLIIFGKRELIMEKLTQWKEDVFGDQEVYNDDDEIIRYSDIELDKDEPGQDITVFDEQDDEDDFIIVEEEHSENEVSNDIPADTENVSVPVNHTPAKMPVKDDIEQPLVKKPVKEEPVDIRKHKIERYVDQQTNKYGLKDLTAGKILIEPIYDEIKPLDYYDVQPFAIVRRGKLWGVIDMKNEKIAEIEYDYINQYVVSREILYLSLNKDNKEGYLRMPDAKIVILVEYENIVRLTNDYKFFQIRKGNRNQSNSYGIIDSYNAVVLPPEYGSVRSTSVANYIKISKYFDVPGSDYKASRYGVLSLINRRIIIPVEYDELDVIGPISFIRVKKDGLWGCINDKNEVTVPIIHIEGGGSATSIHNPEDNRVYMTLPGGERVAYNSKGQKVPYN